MQRLSSRTSVGASVHGIILCLSDECSRVLEESTQDQARDLPTANDFRTSFLKATELKIVVIYRTIKECSVGALHHFADLTAVMATPPRLP